ncbi:SRPBCC family protein [Actinokineospora soli]|uniref:SRPBCC family protein n=1 Tax=Actinokineospora soli TaxID=1048753 RepID=A0ABW2TLG7_9PSEU
MPHFADRAHSAAAPEDVWKLLYDPTRFPEWWAGVGTVERADPGSYTMYPDGYPDFPMPQTLTTAPGCVAISCQVSDLRFEWRLRPDGTGTEITVDVELPSREAHRLPTQRDLIHRSMLALAALAATP